MYEGIGEIVSVKDCEEIKEINIHLQRVLKTWEISFVLLF